MEKNNNGDLLSIYLDEIGKFEKLTQEEILELFKKYKNGDKQAKNKIYYHNLRLVYSIVNKYAKVLVNEDYDIMDLIQDGNIALMTAIEKFDLNKNINFSTFAFTVIKHSVLREYVKNGEKNQISEAAYFKDGKMKKIEMKFELKNGRKPTIEELSKLMGLPISTIEFLKLVRVKTVSLDATIKNSEKDNIVLMDVVSDKNAEIEFENVLNNVENEWIYPLVMNSDFLSVKEKEIFKLYFGFDGNPMGLSEIGEKLNYSREWVRRLRNRVVRKIKYNVDFDKKTLMSKTKSAVQKNF